MKSGLQIFVLFVLLFVYNNLLRAQSGPGGVGNSDGSIGQPENIIWLDASLLPTFGDGSVWSDISGNGYDATHIPSGGNAPGLGTLNGFNTLNFDGTASYLRIPDDDAGANKLDGMTNLTIMAVVNPGSTDTRCVISKRLNATNRSWTLFHNNGFQLNGYVGTTAVGGGVNTSGSYGFASYIVNGNLSLYHNGDLQASGGTGLSIPDRTENVTIGRFDEGAGETRWFDGEIAEIVVFADGLNTAQRTIIENYFSTKYNLAFTTASNDKMTGNDPTYIYGVAGIGQEPDGNHLLAASGSTGFYVESSGSLDNGDYIMFAHNNSANSVSTSDITGGVQERWAKDWYIEQTGSQNARIIFDLPEGITGGQYPQNISNYVLLYRNGTSGNYSIATSSVDYADADQVSFNILGTNLADGYYTLGTLDQTNSPVLGQAGTTWYSLVSGNWSDPTIWTLDPSGALPNNPANSYPQFNTDKVVIKSGKTVVMDLPNPTYTFASVTVNGRLDLQSKTGLTFSVIKGTGRILMSDDVFPSYSNADDFIKAGQGEGTVALYGSSFTLNTAHEFYNLEVKMSVGQTITLTKDLALNGYFRVESGTFKINDDATDIGLNITVKGDVDILSGAYIATGTGSGTAEVRHQFNFYGGLTNNGELRFTNRSSADYNNEALNGIVDANFISSTSNQDVICNGISNFYRIEIDKGTDKTYMLAIEASAVSNFNLFGYANEGHASVAQLTDNNNALGLLRGTVKIGNNVNIPVLNNTGNYNISEAAQLWVDGGTVTKSAGTAIVPYGTARISAGTFEALVASGFTLRDNGLIKIDGGTLNANQVRTSVLGIGNVGGYIQSGGTVNIVNPGNTNTNYYHFSLTYTGNVFNMSGGTLHVYDANGTATNQGGIFIASDPKNINITGGTVIAEIAGVANTFKITSKAPFWDLILRNTNDASTDHLLDAGTNINGTSDADLVAQPLVVLNDLTIEDNCFLNHNGQDITIGAGLSISSNSQNQGTNNDGLLYDAGLPNTLTFNGSTSDTLYIGHTVDDPYELYVWNLVINKSNNAELVVKGDAAKEAGNASPESHNRLLRVNGTIDVQNGTLNQGKQSISLFGVVNVGANGILGVYEPGVTDITSYIMLDDTGGNITLNTEDGAQLGNFKLDPGNGNAVAISSDIYIKRIGMFNGSLNIGSYKLKLDYLHNQSTTTIFTGGSSNGMIYSTANASDGGIELYIPAGTADGTQYEFPLGTNTGTTRFTPALVDLSGVVDDGYIQIRPVIGELQTTNLTGGDLLGYYWRVGYSDFTTLPTVTYKFTYENTDVVGNENNYVPGKVLDETPFTRSAPGGSVSTGQNEINFPATTLEKTNYTAGETNRFTGTVQVFYTRRLLDAAGANWEDGNLWTFAPNDIDGNSTVDSYELHDSRQPAAGDWPQAGDIAVVGWVPFGDPTYTDGYPHGVEVDNAVNFAELRFTQMLDANDGNPTSRQYAYNFQFRPTVCVNPGGVINGSIIAGEGMFWLRSTGGSQVDPDFSSIDIGDFISQDSSYLVYESTNNGFIYNNIPSIVPNLMIASDGWGAQDRDFEISTDVEIKQDFELLGDVNLMLSSGTAGDFIVGNDLRIFRNNANGNDSGGDGEIAFPNDASRSIEVFGDLELINNQAIIHVEIPNTTVFEGNLIVHGNIIQDNTTGGGLQLYSAADEDYIKLTLNGTGNHSYSISSGATANLYNIVFNKGTDQTSSFSFDSNFLLNGPTSGVGVTKALDLQSGTCILNNASININLTTGDDDFEIPSTACLEVRQGQANANGESGILLDGKLLVSGGTVDMSGGDNYIEYSATGNATIEITDGTLNVGSQIRRALSSDQGILTFNQSGGTVNVGISAAGQNSRGIFEILNAGSSFTHSAGDFYLVNDYRSNPSIQSFYFDPEIVNLSSGTAITFGNANTVATERFFTLYAGQNLMNLAIDNTSTFNPSLTLNIVPLTLDESLTIGNGSILNANGLDINISGNFTNAGTFTANENTTIFEGTDAQIITGATTFYNLTKNTANDLSLAASSEITIDNILSLEAGTFNDNDNNVNVKGNLHSVITTTSAGTSDGIILNGTVEQEVSGDGTYAKLMINNPNGILVPTGNTITIEGNLKMQNGIFDIGRNLLILNENTSIVEASPFSESNMIQTNISFTDAGVRKYFPAITSATQFIYPMGSAGKYTPVQFDITACDAGGSIRVRAADEMHISIIEDSEAPNPEITDADNVLQYHWTLDASGIAGFSATATMEAYPDDIAVTSPYTVADYITASLIDADLGTWSKYDAADFNEATNELYFYFAGTNDLGIDGDYTAGIDDAIPAQVPSYISITDGPWNDAATWDTYPIAGGSVPAGGPRGAIMYIEHNVTMPVNFMAAYITNIRSTGVVNVGTTFGHRLGIVNGTGEIYLQRGDMPAGVYDGFFAPDSGTIVFNGSTNYDILSEFTYVNNLTLIGTGERRFPNLSLTIYGDLVIGDGGDTPEVINEHYQTISVYKDVHFNSGTFTAGFGNDATFRLAGDIHQTIYGNFTGTNSFWNFEINNSTGASLSSSDIEIDNELLLTSGVISSSSTNTITLDSQSENIVTGGSSSSYVNGSLFKNIINGQSFYFPVGNSGRYGEVYVQSDNSNATGYWQAQYYNQNPGSAGYDPTNPTLPLTMVSNNEYWRIQSPTGSDNGSVGLRWDSQSGMPTSDASDRSQLGIVEWRDPNNNPADGNLADDLWEDIGGAYTTSAPGTSGTISSDAVITFDEFTGTGNIFTLSSEATASSPIWQGDVSSDWHTPGNWSTNSVPNSIDVVSIPNTGVSNEPVISSGAVAGATTIESARTLTIAANGSLTLSGNLTMDGNITIESSASGTGSLLDNGNISGGGTATVQRFISGGDPLQYHYFSSPLSAVPSSLYRLVPGESPNPNFYWYNENFDNIDLLYGWQLVGASYGNLQVGLGYTYAFSRDYTFNMTGGGFNTGNQSIAITHNSNNGALLDGWNLVGNPYPSALSAEDLLTANASVIDGTVYFWDDDGTEGTGYSSDDYATWNLAGAIGSSSGSGSKVPDGFIANGQGFFVHKTSGTPASENLNFTNSMRRIGNGQFFKNAPTDDVMRIRLSLTNDAEKLYNEALIVFINEATDGHDHFFDGRKNKGNPDIAFYSLLDNNEYAIQSFKPLSNKTNNVKEVPMGYSVSKDGTYSFNSVQFENIASDFDVYLEDKLEKKTINLKVQNYSFATVKGTYNDRFVLRFNYKNENTNSAPILREKLANISTLEDESFGYKVSENAFGDVDVNDELSYTARLVGGGNLPSWLNFNNQTLGFSGTPTNDDIELLTIELTATDLFGESVSDIFTLEVINVNDAPELINAIADQEVVENTNYSFTIPVNTFADVDKDDEITLSVGLANGEDLPAWLQFNNANNTLSGTAINSGEINIKVTAIDKAGALASDDFKLTVKSTTNINEYEFAKNVRIYPNPTKGRLVIISESFEVGTRFIVRDYHGKTVLEKQGEGSKTDIDLSEFAAGVYFIEIRNNEKSKIFKVILNK